MVNSCIKELDRIGMSICGCNIRFCPSLFLFTLCVPCFFPLHCRKHLNLHKTSAWNLRCCITAPSIASRLQLMFFHHFHLLPACLPYGVLCCIKTPQHARSLHLQSVVVISRSCPSPLPYTPCFPPRLASPPPPPPSRHIVRHISRT